jgi:heme-degrading monooxygenase HmoA
LTISAEAKGEELQFVALSRFIVANGMEKETLNAFRNRPHLVDETNGFLRMEVLLSKDKPTEFWLLTWWRDEASYTTWHKSHEYHESHAYIPKGLKLLPGSTHITLLELVAR